MTRKTRTLLGLAAIGLASTYAYASATAGSQRDAPQEQQQLPARVSQARVVIIHVFADPPGAYPDPARAHRGDVVLWMGVPGDAIEIAFSEDRNPTTTSAMPVRGVDVVVARVDTSARRGIYKYTLTVNDSTIDPDVIVW